MKVATFVTIPALLSCFGSAQADWNRGFRNETAEATVYVDPLSLRKDGGRIRLNVLSDLQVPDTYLGIPYHSVRTVKEYDCRTSMIRTVRVDLYSGPMGHGELVGSDIENREDWKPLAAKRGAASIPQKIAAAFTALMCGS